MCEERKSDKLPLVEEFYSIQGEGFNSGLAAWFIRLGGCDIGCSWCDSPFTWDPLLYTEVETDLIVANAVRSGADSAVVTGGEPLMWNLDYLCTELKKENIKTYIETSGAYPLSGIWDWICLSPKKNMPPDEQISRHADELKVIIQTDDDFSWAEECSKMVSEQCRKYLQPEWSSFEKIIPSIVSYVKRNSKWRISLQIHKYMHIP